MAITSGGTYRTFDEIRERLTPPEERFERNRRTIGLVAGPILGLAVFFLTSGLTDPQQRLAAILTFVIVYWITEAIPIPVTAVIGLALCVLVGVAPGDDVFGAFSSSTIFLFIGSFIIAQAMMRHGLHRRFAFRMLAIKGVATSSHRTIIVFGLVAMTISAFVSNTATTAMLLPIAIGVVTTLAGFMGGAPAGRQPEQAASRLPQQPDHEPDHEPDQRPQQRSGQPGPPEQPVQPEQPEQPGQPERPQVDPQRLRFATAVMLMVAYGASVGGLLTPVGSPPNLIGRTFIEDATGTKIPFFTWMLNAVPIVIIMFVVLCVLLIFLNRPETKHIEGAREYVERERANLGPLSRGERNTLIAFAVAVVLWVTPGVIALIAGDDSPVYEAVSDHMDEGVVAILAATLLFVLPIDWATRRFTLTWNEAVRIDWGTIILFGSGIALGGLLSKTGLAKSIGGGITNLLGVQSLLGLTILATVIAILISETTSNTASVGIVVPIVLPIAAAAGVNPVIPALAAVFGASYGFMLPVSTPPNAIVYGSGMVPITKMVRSGVVFDVIGIVLIVAGVTVMAQLTGLA